MNSIPAKMLYNKISQALQNTKWLEDIKISRDFISKYIKSPDFINTLDMMVKTQNYSCTVVLSLCRYMMNELSENDTPENWLDYIYQFTLSKSFPDSVIIKLMDSLSSPCEIYLRVLKAVSQFQMQSKDGTWQSTYPLIFLTSDEENGLESIGEYRRFIQSFNDEYIYELMKLGQEVYGYNTLDHICGVHYLSLFIGRQLKAQGLPIDMGRVSGAAAGHDIGKYGCKGRELERVPYLHYYYSDQWFKKNDITYIRHIALNHSTWDLELENLSLESLILIYSDFRVKNVDDKMQIMPLNESFSAILNKLDNVNESKEKRYRRVYAKLKDFEDYMVHLGINIDPGVDTGSIPYNTVNHSLLQGQQVIDNIKYIAITHNINLMYQLRDELSLDNILQLARSEKDWKILREYIRIFEEYSTYLTQRQKLQTIRFLYEQMTHPEDDIRRHCAELIGALIAIYDEDYRKEIPENVVIEHPSPSSSELLDEYLHFFLYPGHKIIPDHRSWMGYSASIMIHSLFTHCPIDLCSQYKMVILKYYTGDTHKSREVQLYLLKIAENIPLSENEEGLEGFYNFILEMLRKQSIILRLSSYETICTIIPYTGRNSELASALKQFFETKLSRSNVPGENFLRMRAASLLGISDDIIEKLSHYCRMDRKKIPDMFLSNLKTATDWVVKKIQVDLLLEHTLENPGVNGLHTAMHFCNLLKVSAIENVRTRAGEAIVKIMPHLPLEQRNDVAVELIRALEIEGYHFAEYIPHYLGQLILWLQPVELDEIIDDLIEKIKQANSQIKFLLLKTIGVLMESYPCYRTRFPEKEGIYEDRLVKILGILLNGLADYNPHVKQSAFSVFGKYLFGSRNLNLEQKNHIFKLTAKKILTLIGDSKDEKLQLLNNSANLNHLYRFISDYTFFNGKIKLDCPEKIAFFPGTFDPFTLGHKEIAKMLRNSGFEVYLAVDEFSWSKRTLPNLLRRNIIAMSIADELGIYLYPEDYPTNIAAPEDLVLLKKNFPSSSVYIVVGSDVILNASSYNTKKAENSIHTFPHIIIDRGSHLSSDENSKLEKSLKNIDGEIIRLSLSRQYTNISSTQIRNYIDESRDISSLIDPLVQQYIYDHGFYQRVPQEKEMLQTTFSLNISIEEVITPQLIHEVSSLLDKYQYEISKKLIELSRKPSSRLVIIRDDSQRGRILGFSALHWVRSYSLYEEFKDSSICEYIRENTAGRIAIIDGIFTGYNLKNKSMEQILLTETLSFALAKDYQYAIYHCMLDNYSPVSVNEVLTLQGFVKIYPEENDNPSFIVDMTNPCVLNLDVETIMKEPFKGSLKVRQAVEKSRKRLQEALTKLYPGELVLSFDIGVQHELMIRKICSENGVPPSITNPRKLGPAMCVPYGNILDWYVIPNTVTKALHTEKLFSPEMDDFKIGPFPHYLGLDIQVKTIRSFNRPVILVDDLLHKGYRLKALDPIFKNENVKIQKIIVGILSGRGKELMDRQNRNVEGVYFLPRLRAWFNENSLYPFMGGDALWRGLYPERNLLPSINLILPYTSPTFISDASKESIYNLSRVAIENSISILKTLENEYHILNEKSLTLASLGQVFITPRCPEHGRNMDYDLNLSPSSFLENDLELLKRLENIIRRI